MPSPKSILVYRTGQLGDTVCAIPAFRAIRENYREAEITLLYDMHDDKSLPVSKDVIADLNVFDDYTPYNPKDVFTIDQARSLFRKIKAKNIDVLFYLLQGERSPSKKLRDSLFSKACGVKKIIGLNEDFQSSSLHETDRLLKILNQEGISTNGKVSFDLPINEKHVKMVDELWKGLNISSSMIVAIGSGSKMPVKRWPVERYKKVGDSLIEKYGAYLIVLGGKEDKESGEILSDSWGKKHSVNIAGMTSYMESAEILRRCNLYLGNDTGVMHLAAAVGTKCVAIFSARDRKYRWYPYGDKYIVLRRDVPCQQCMFEVCEKNNMKCIMDISEEEVMKGCSNCFSHSK